MVYARAKAQEAGYGLETELAEPDGALVSAAAAAAELLESLQKPLAALARRLEAVLEDAPDWLDAQARARVEGAIRGLVVAARDARGVDRAARRGSAARPIPSSSTGWRSSGSTGANMTSRSTAAGSTRPSRWPARCWRRPTACWSPRRRCAAARTGRRPRRAPARCTCPAPVRAFRGGKPVRLCRLLGSADRHRRRSRATSPRSPAPMRG